MRLKIQHADITSLTTALSIEISLVLMPLYNFQSM